MALVRVSRRASALRDPGFVISIVLYGRSIAARIFITVVLKPLGLINVGSHRSRFVVLWCRFIAPRKQFIYPVKGNWPHRTKSKVGFLFSDRAINALIASYLQPWSSTWDGVCLSLHSNFLCSMPSISKDTITLMLLFS